MQIFFKQPPPYPPSLMAQPTPPEVGTHKCFCQNGRKGCSLDYLDGYGHFLFGFGVAGKNNQPPW